MKALFSIATKHPLMKHFTVIGGSAFLIWFTGSCTFHSFDETPPTPFEVTVDSIDTREARLSWPMHKGLGKNFVLYTVILGGDTIMNDSYDSAMRLYNLKSGTQYSGIVIANELSGSSTRASFKFKTLRELHYIERFDNQHDWTFSISKYSADTRTSATLGASGLTLLAGTGSRYTDFGARAAATKIVKEFSLLNIAKVKEIKINADFNSFALATFASPNFHLMSYKLGPYSIVISTKLPHSNTPPVKRFEISISIPDGDLYSAKAMMKMYFLAEGNFQREIYWRNAEFDIYLDKFEASPIVTFSAETGNNDNPVYPLYSNTFIVKSLEIIATGE